MKKRESYLKIWHTLSEYKKLFLLTGPRQVGKTTLSKIIADNFKNKIYFNYDFISNKRKIIEEPLFFETVNRIDASIPLVILDEIHKYKDWKNYLKGVYDEFSNDYVFLITGSGRLNIYKKGGDSLAGRYLQFHLFPFTMSELSNSSISIQKFLSNPLIIEKIGTSGKTLWKKLAAFSGFPEPFLKNKKEFFNIWSSNYTSQLIREDIRNMHALKNTENLELLFSLLPERTGSPISQNKLSKIIKVSFDTIKSWLMLFDEYFLTFRIKPWSLKLKNSILKEFKIYLYNYAVIIDEAKKFENMIALELYRAVTNWNELGYGNFGLFFVRNKKKEEVDFLIVNRNKPFLLIESKLNSETLSESLIKFQNVFKIPGIQLTSKDNVCRLKKNDKNRILLITAHNWLRNLP